MIKRILVALDPDTDTPVATRNAVEIARRHDAAITGLAVVDTGNIEAGARGGGIGSMYYAEKLRERLTEETRTAAHDLIREFESVLGETGLEFVDYVKEGVPFERILEDMKYHDLLVVGKTPHFFYGHPEEETETLVRIVRETIAPALVVGDVYNDVRRVLIAYDGSPSAARALQRFIHLQPFGKELEVQVLHAHEGDASESELLLQLATSYLGAHGFSASPVSVQNDSPHEAIVGQAERFGADIVVAGAHSVSKLRRIAFGSTTASLLDSCPTPLFLHS